MHTKKILFFSFLMVFGAVSTSYADNPAQLGIGYGFQFKDNTDLSQYELFWRQPLPYKTTIFDSWDVTTDFEFGAALVTESGSDNSDGGRFSVMPQVVLSPNEMIHLKFGFGAGFMVGNTEFKDHDLGGSFLLASKLGVEISLSTNWGLEYTYYHQSNAGVYDENDGLNMHLFSIVYSF